MRKAFSDLIYLIGLWFILRVNPHGAADLLHKWAEAIKMRNF